MTSFFHYSRESSAPRAKADIASGDRSGYLAVGTEIRSFERRRKMREVTRTGTADETRKSRQPTLTAASGPGKEPANERKAGKKRRLPSPAAPADLSRLIFDIDLDLFRDVADPQPHFPKPYAYSRLLRCFLERPSFRSTSLQPLPVATWRAARVTLRAPRRTAAYRSSLRPHRRRPHEHSPLLFESRNEEFPVAVEGKLSGDILRTAGCPPRTPVAGWTSRLAATTCRFGADLPRSFPHPGRPVEINPAEKVKIFLKNEKRK